MKLSISESYIVSNYLLFTILMYGYNMLSLPKSPFYIVKLLLVLIVCYFTIKRVLSFGKKSSELRFILGYIIYLFISFSFILLSDLSLLLIPDAFISGIFPIFFALLGAKTKKNILEDKFYQNCFWGCIFMYVCSIYLFIASPGWYMAWRIEMLPDEWKNTIQVVGCLSGFSATGYLVGYSSLFAFCYMIFKIKYGEKKKCDILILLVIIFCLVFSQSRISILMALVILIWYIFTIIRRGNFLLLISLGFIAFLISYFIALNSEILIELFQMLLSRFEGVSEDSRYKTGLKLLSNQTNFMFGHGYGSGGNYASSLGYNAVTDAEYFKLFYETGILGFFYFSMIIGLCFKRILYNRRSYAFEFFIISFYLIAMLIANPLSLEPMLAPIFWYSVGRVLY